MRSALILVLALAAGERAFAAEDVIIVTAERRAQPADAQAGNTAVLSAAAIARVGAQHPAELMDRAPGVNIQRGQGVESLPAIRSPVLIGGQGAGEILVLEDGVPIRAPGLANVNEVWETGIEFADRVEITRGPGSALYGDNAVHGIINVITPSAADERFDALAEIGSFGRWRGSALVAHDGGLFGAAVRHEDGWRDNSGLDQQKALLGWDGALAGWDVRARADYVNLNQDTAGYVLGTSAYKNRTLSKQNPDGPLGARDSEVARVQADLTRNVSDTLSVKITPYGRWIEATLQQHFLPSKAREDTSQAGGGVQSGLYWDPAKNLSLIFGVDLDDTHGELTEFQFIPTQPNGYVQGLHYNYTVDARVAAAYAQARWTFAPRWSLTAGLRGEDVRYEYDNRAPTNDFGRFRRIADRKDSFDTATPKLGLVREFASGGSAFLNYARGARAPQTTDLYELQTNQQAGQQPAQTINSVELGLRKPLFGGRIEASLYHMDKAHDSFRNADGFTVSNAKTRHQGVEVSANFPLGRYFEIAGWATYAEHTYRFTNISARDPNESIISGTDVDTAPRRLANLHLIWRPLRTFETELSWDHVGRYATNAASTHFYPGHDVFDLRAEWSATDRISLFAAVRNLTDLKYAERADYAFGNDRYFPGEPRAFSIGLRARR
jgi:outer membrane receptor protein involved in Fe transport